MRIGVPISTSELPPATRNTFNTATAFKVGLGDSGVASTPYRCLSTNDVTAAIGPRSLTNAVLWDDSDNYFRQGGSTLYISRVVGPTPVLASRTLQDVTPHPTVVVTAKTPGADGNALFVHVTVGGGNYTVTIEDSAGDVLETHGPFATSSGNAPLLADTTSTLVTFTQSAGSGFTTVSPAALSAVALSGGSDDRADATLASWTAALNGFGSNLGPGQVSAPGQTNTTLSGIWSALGTHAMANNRVAICDMDGGQCIIPGITPGTTRTVPASSAISALCAQADAGGNPNQAAAGDSFPLTYVTGFTNGTAAATLVSNLGTFGTSAVASYCAFWAAGNYTQADIDTLNAAGINTFNTVGVVQNYGFVSSVLPTSDIVYWQFSHSRLRMALAADFQIIGQPFVFSQIDGKGLDAAAFSGRLAAALQQRVKAGAIYTQAPGGGQDQGFAIDTGPSVNTPTSIANGQLGANVEVRMSPFAQLIPINLIAIPVTQNL